MIKKSVKSKPLNQRSAIVRCALGLEMFKDMKLRAPKKYKKYWRIIDKIFDMRAFLYPRKK